MRGEKGIRELRDELVRIVNFIEDHGTEEESENAELDFATDVVDTLQWVLADLSNKESQDHPYLNMPKLEEIAREIEERTGEALREQE